MPPDIIDNETLRKLSGKEAPSAVRRWADRQGIRTFESAGGPATTRQAINWALGVGTSNQREYRPEDIA